MCFMEKVYSLTMNNEPACIFELASIDYFLTSCDNLKELFRCIFLWVVSEKKKYITSTKASHTVSDELVYFFTEKPGIMFV